MSWQEGRPTFLRLPERGYQDNVLTDALTTFADEKLVETADRLQNFYKELNPVTAKAESLDYLAAIVGMSKEYWDIQWSEVVKRQMIALAPFLWKNRGTLRSISAVLGVHGMTYRYWTDGSLRVPFPIGSKIGSSTLRIYVRLPLTYHRHGVEFREAQRTLNNYSPAVIESAVVYDKFYVGFSRVGEPVFS